MEETLQPKTLQNLFDLALECAKKGIGSELGYDQVNQRVFFRIHIGSKTGTGDLYLNDGEIVLETRYQKINVVNDFDDIVNVAFDWFEKYCEREPFTSPDGLWVKFFEEKGWVKKIVKTEYVKNI
jgi:hypothetical protein